MILADFTLRQLHYLVTVAEIGSISGAAQQLYVSHTAVSTALTELEKVLRSQLLVRRKAHGITLTPTGQYVLKQAQSILELSDELQLSAASQGTELRGALRVGCFATLAPTIASALWSAYSKKYPQVDLSFETGTQGHIPQGVLSGELDLGIAYDAALPAGLSSIRLYTLKPHILLPPEHPLANHQTVTLQQLRNEPMIQLDAQPSISRNAELFRKASLTPRIAYHTADFELTRSLVARGFGYAILHQRPEANVTYEGRPLAVRDLDTANPIDIRMIWAEDIALNRRTTAMLDLAKTVGAQMS